MQIRTACSLRGQYLAVCAPPLYFFASVAQLAEQRIRNAQVAGSIPAGSSIMGKKEPVRIGVQVLVFFVSLLYTMDLP